MSDGNRACLCTARGVLILDGRFVILRRRSFPHKWEFPGGKIKKTETAIIAQKREFEEETGLLVNPISGMQFFTTYSQGECRRIAFFSMVEMVGGRFKLSDEHSAVMFVPVREIQRYDLTSTTRKILDMILP